MHILLAEPTVPQKLPASPGILLRPINIHNGVIAFPYKDPLRRADPYNPLPSEAEIRCRRCGTWVLQKIEMDLTLYLHTIMSSKTFTRWTEEERRAHRRKQNATYQARKVENLTPREKQVKEEERRKRQATKQAMEQGEWISATVTIKVEKEEKKATKVAKNGFAALESDEEKEVQETKETWGKQKINWADSDDE